MEAEYTRLAGGMQLSETLTVSTFLLYLETQFEEKYNIW